MTSPAKPSTGAWYGLAAILEDRQREFEAREQITVADGGEACPVCGEPLSQAPAGGSVSRFCAFAGDHRFEAPGDVVAPRYDQMMGRHG